MQVFRIIIIRNIKIIQILFKIKKFNHLFLLYFIFAFFQIHLRIILFFPFSQQNQCLLLLCKCNAHVLLDFIFSKNCINYFIEHIIMTLEVGGVIINDVLKIYQILNLHRVATFTDGDITLHLRNQSKIIPIAPSLCPATAHMSR